MAFNRTEPILVHGIIGDGMHAQLQFPEPWDDVVAIHKVNGQRAWAGGFPHGVGRKAAGRQKQALVRPPLQRAPEIPNLPGPNAALVALALEEQPEGQDAAQPQHAHAVQAAVARAARDLRLHKAQLPQRLQSPGHPLVLGRNGDVAHGRPLFHDDYTIPVRGLRALRPRARG